MTAFFVALALVFFLTGGDAQQPPNLPNSFRANVTVEYEGGKAAGEQQECRTLQISVRLLQALCDDVQQISIPFERCTYSVAGYRSRSRPLTSSTNTEYLWRR